MDDKSDRLWKYNKKSLVRVYHEFLFGLSLHYQPLSKKCEYKLSPKSQVFQQVEAHSVTRAGSVITCYEQLLSMFHEGMPKLI